MKVPAPKVTTAEPFPMSGDISGARVARAKSTGGVLIRAADGKVYTATRYPIHFLHGGVSRQLLALFCKLTGQRQVDFARYRKAQSDARDAKLAKTHTARLRRDAARNGFKLVKLPAAKVTP